MKKAGFVAGVAVKKTTPATSCLTPRVAHLCQVCQRCKEYQMKNLPKMVYGYWEYFEGEDDMFMAGTVERDVICPGDGTTVYGVYELKEKREGRLVGKKGYKTQVAK